jgi:hypothetical protein
MSSPSNSKCLHCLAEEDESIPCDECGAAAGVPCDEATCPFRIRNRLAQLELEAYEEEEEPPAPDEEEEMKKWSYEEEETAASTVYDGGPSGTYYVAYDEKE